MAVKNELTWVWTTIGTRMVKCARCGSTVLAERRRYFARERGAMRTGMAEVHVKHGCVDVSLWSSTGTAAQGPRARS